MIFTGQVIGNARPRKIRPFLFLIPSLLVQERNSVTRIVQVVTVCVTFSFPFPDPVAQVQVGVELIIAVIQITA